MFKLSWHLLLVKWPSYHRDKILPHSLRNVFSIIVGCKVGRQDRTWAPCTCCVTCVRLLTGWVCGSRQMPFAVTTVWREPKDQSANHFKKHNRDCLQIQPHSEISKCDTCNEACPTQCRVANAKASKKSFSDNNSHFDDEDDRQLEGDKVGSNPTFDTCCSSSEPHLLI